MSEGAARPMRHEAEPDAVEQFKQAIGRDAMLAAYLDKQVADRWNAHVQRLGKGAWPGLLLASALLGIFGWREFANWSRIRESVEKSARDTTEKAAQADKLVQSAQNQAVETQKHFETQQARIAAAQAESVKTISVAQEALRQSLERIDRQLLASEQHSERMRRNEDQAHQLLMGLKRQVQDAEDSLKSTKQANDKVLEDQRLARSNLEESTLALRNVQGSVSRSQADIQRNLNAAFCRQVEYVTLRSRSSRLIELIGPPSDLSDPGKYVEPRKYEIMFNTDGIKDDFMLKIAVKQLGEVRPLPPYEKMKASEHQFPITGTPFGHRVEFVYHAKLAFDFVILKVSPDETQYGGLCGFTGVARR